MPRSLIFNYATVQAKKHNKLIDDPMKFDTFTHNNQQPYTNNNMKNRNFEEVLSFMDDDS